MSSIYINLFGFTAFFRVESKTCMICLLGKGYNLCLLECWLIKILQVQTKGLMALGLGFSILVSLVLMCLSNIIISFFFMKFVPWPASMNWAFNVHMSNTNHCHWRINLNTCYRAISTCFQSSFIKFLSGVA